MATGLAITFLLNQMRCYSGSLAGGTVEFFEAGTSTHLDVFLDYQCLQTAANPYTLSADGTAELFGIGSYRIVVRNSAGVIVYDYDNVFLAPDIDFGTLSGSPVLTTVVDTTSGALLHTLATSPSTQTIIMKGNTGWTVTISAPGTNTFADGSLDYVLYSDNESVTFYLNGAVWYRVT